MKIAKKAKSLVNNISRFNIKYRFATIIYNIGSAGSESFVRRNFNLEDMKKNVNWYKLVQEK